MEKLLIGALSGLFVGAVVVEIVRRKFPVLPKVAVEGPSELEVSESLTVGAHGHQLADHRDVQAVGALAPAEQSCASGSALGPSQSASSGSGWASRNNPARPTAMPARARSPTCARRPPEAAPPVSRHCSACVTSKIRGA